MVKCGLGRYDKCFLQLCSSCSFNYYHYCKLTSSCDCCSQTTGNNLQLLGCIQLSMFRYLSWHKIAYLFWAFFFPLFMLTVTFYLFIYYLCNHMKATNNHKDAVPETSCHIQFSHRINVHIFFICSCLQKALTCYVSSICQQGYLASV